MMFKRVVVVTILAMVALLIVVRIQAPDEDADNLAKGWFAIAYSAFGFGAIGFHVSRSGLPADRTLVPKAIFCLLVLLGSGVFLVLASR